MPNDVMELVTNITRRALQLNTTITDRKTTGDKPTVMINFMGHVCCFEVLIFSNGWQRGCMPDKRFSIYLNSKAAKTQLWELNDYITRLAVKECY